ncbi:hypothetical protein MJH12_11265, partial [bacterium]|nr:hypothetical protein [bacterium]
MLFFTALTSKFTASLESNNGECFNGVCIAPCQNEELFIRPNLGAIGNASLELRLDDGLGGQASKVFSFTIVDTKPKFIIGGLSEDKMTFRSDANIVLDVDTILIDDDDMNVVVEFNEAGLGNLGGFWYEYPDGETEKLVQIVHNNQGQLVFVPKYDGFTGNMKDGKQRVLLYYKDKEAIDPQTSQSVQHITSSMFTINIKHGFLEWAKFDDTNGDKIKGSGDRLLLKFSDSSGGVYGLTTSTQLPPIISEITAENINFLIKTLNNSSPIASPFGAPVVDISYFDANFVEIEDSLVNPFT